MSINVFPEDHHNHHDHHDHDRSNWSAEGLSESIDAVMGDLQEAHNMPVHDFPPGTLSSKLDSW